MFDSGSGSGSGSSRVVESFVDDDDDDDKTVPISITSSYDNEFYPTKSFPSGSVGNENEDIGYDNDNDNDNDDDDNDNVDDDNIAIDARVSNSNDIRRPNRINHPERDAVSGLSTSSHCTNAGASASAGATANASASANAGAGFTRQPRNENRSLQNREGGVAATKKSSRLYDGTGPRRTRTTFKNSRANSRSEGVLEEQEEQPLPLPLPLPLLRNTENSDSIPASEFLLREERTGTSSRRLPKKAKALRDIAAYNRDPVVPDRCWWWWWWWGGGARFVVDDDGIVPPQPPAAAVAAAAAGGEALSLSNGEESDSRVANLDSGGRLRRRRRNPRRRVPVVVALQQNLNNGLSMDSEECQASHFVGERFHRARRLRRSMA